MVEPQMQTGIIVVQNRNETSLPLGVSNVLPKPTDFPSEAHVLIRVLAVALNPTDFKMVNHFPTPGSMVGCDFCGVVEEVGTVSPKHPVGTRVCGAVFPYNPEVPTSGAFAEWVVADSRLLLRVPSSLDDLGTAAVGGVGWGTAGLAFYDPQALALAGRPSQPIDKKEPVLVYGGATASGTMACQLLKLSGYAPIAVTSTASAPLALEYGAVNTAAYTSPACVNTIKSIAGGASIRRILDCITNSESVAICFAAMARTGGRYACLENLHPSWMSRRAIHTKEVMGFEALGVRIDLGPSSYSRDANQELFDICVRWATEMQTILDSGLIKSHPIQEISGQWEGIVGGLGMLQRGEVRGHKLVVRVTTLS